MSAEMINPPTLAPPVMNLYTQVVAATGTRFVAIAGQVAIDTEGQLVGPGDFAAQAEQVFRNLRAALEAAGATPADLIKMTIHVVGHRPEMIDMVFTAGSKAFDGEWPLPASTYLGVEALGLPEWLIEVDGYAVIA